MFTCAASGGSIVRSHLHRRKLDVSVSAFLFIFWIESEATCKEKQKQKATTMSRVGQYRTSGAAAHALDSNARAPSHLNSNTTRLQYNPHVEAEQVRAPAATRHLFLPQTRATTHERFSRVHSLFNFFPRFPRSTHSRAHKHAPYARTLTRAGAAVREALRR